MPNDSEKLINRSAGGREKIARRERNRFRAIDTPKQRLERFARVRFCDAVRELRPRLRDTSRGGFLRLNPFVDAAAHDFANRLAAGGGNRSQSRHYGRIGAGHKLFRRHRKRSHIYERCTTVRIMPNNAAQVKRRNFSPCLAFCNASDTLMYDTE